MSTVMVYHSSNSFPNSLAGLALAPTFPRTDKTILRTPFVSTVSKLCWKCGMCVPDSTKTFHCWHNNILAVVDIYLLARPRGEQETWHISISQSWVDLISSNKPWLTSKSTSWFIWSLVYYAFTPFSWTPDTSVSERHIKIAGRKCQLFFNIIIETRLSL